MKPISILLVDDNQNFLRAEKHFLERKKSVKILGEVCEGRKVLAQVESLQPQVILLDLAMPEVTGLQLLPKLRSRYPAIGVVALTVMDTAVYREASRLAGADAFLSKSRLSTELVPTIRLVAAAAQARALNTAAD